MAAAARHSRLGGQSQEASHRAATARLRPQAARTDELCRNCAAGAQALRQQRINFVARVSKRRRTLACLDAPKQFDAADLEQDRANAGGPRHSAMRRELLERVTTRVVPVPAELPVNLDRS